MNADYIEQLESSQRDVGLIVKDLKHGGLDGLQSAIMGLKTVENDLHQLRIQCEIAERKAVKYGTPQLTTPQAD